MNIRIFIYETVLFLLVIVSVIIALTSNERFTFAHWIIWGIFFVDYFVRLVRANHRWQFIKSHPLELVAIIPLDAIYQAARFFYVLPDAQTSGHFPAFFKACVHPVENEWFGEVVGVCGCFNFSRADTDDHDRTANRQLQ